MQQVYRTIRTANDWRRFLRTFAGRVNVTFHGHVTQIRHQHAIAAFVLEAAQTGGIPHVEIVGDQATIHVTHRARYVPVPG